MRAQVQLLRTFIRLVCKQVDIGGMSLISICSVSHTVIELLVLLTQRGMAIVYIVWSGLRVGQGEHPSSSLPPCPPHARQ